MRNAAIRIAMVSFSLVACDLSTKNPGDDASSLADGIYVEFGTPGDTDVLGNGFPQEEYDLFFPYDGQVYRSGHPIGIYAWSQWVFNGAPQAGGADLGIVLHKEDDNTFWDGNSWTTLSFGFDWMDWIDRDPAQGMGISLVRDGLCTVVVSQGNDVSHCYIENIPPDALGDCASCVIRIAAKEPGDVTGDTLIEDSRTIIIDLDHPIVSLDSPDPGVISGYPLTLEGGVLQNFTGGRNASQNIRLRITDLVVGVLIDTSESVTDENERHVYLTDIDEQDLSWQRAFSEQMALAGQGLYSLDVDVDAADRSFIPDVTRFELRLSNSPPGIELLAPTDSQTINVSVEGSSLTLQMHVIDDLGVESVAYQLEETQSEVFWRDSDASFHPEEQWNSVHQDDWSCIDALYTRDCDINYLTKVLPASSYALTVRARDYAGEESLVSIDIELVESP